jgi:hypothetical protein
MTVTTNLKEVALLRSPFSLALAFIPPVQVSLVFMCCRVDLLPPVCFSPLFLSFWLLTSDRISLWRAWRNLLTTRLRPFLPYVRIRLKMTTDALFVQHIVYDGFRPGKQPFVCSEMGLSGKKTQHKK